ncbi:MAG: hypothetical protein H7338_13415, partial [Candidatus Sericytochromatia bacterium]|nr:hypothetical protein [Candidatus Sericytochromatia bacterium]
QAQLFASRSDVTPQMMTQMILGFAEEMRQGPERGWQAAKSLLEMATFSKQWQVQAQIQLERIANGTDLPSQRCLLALGGYPYAAEVDQIALRQLLSAPKIRPALEKWAATLGHPLKQTAQNFLTFMTRRD